MVFIKNNLVLILFCLALTIGACGKKPINRTSPLDNIETNKPDDRGKPIMDNPQTSDNKVIIPKTDDPFEGRTTDTETTDADAYREYNVGMMLPFNVMRNNLDFANDSVDDKSKLALEFYEGAVIALQELQKEGMNLNVYVYDTEKDPEKVEMLLKQSAMKKLDVLIGPVYNKPLKIASEFAKRNKVLMVSPFSPSTNFVTNNPYFFTMEPSAQTHCAEMYNYIREIPEYNNVVLLNQARTSEMKLADVFKRLDNAAPVYTDIEKTGFHLEQLVFSSSQTPEQDYELLRGYLKPNQANVFIVTSYSEQFVNDMLRRLYFFKDEFEIVVFGMPNWVKFENINIDYLMDLNIHFTGNYYANSYLPEVQMFNQKYRSKLNSKPPSRACMGYDMVHFLGDFIQTRKPNDMIVDINAEKNEETFSGYQMFPVYNDTTNAINCYENKHLFISKYQDYQIIRVK